MGILIKASIALAMAFVVIACSGVVSGKADEVDEPALPVAVPLTCPMVPPPSFTPVVTPAPADVPARQHFYIVAVADFNADGFDDVVYAIPREHSGLAEDRHDRRKLYPYLSTGDGSFRHAPDLLGGEVWVSDPIVVAADLNGDSLPDLAVFDAGVYVWSESTGVGNPPQLFLSDGAVLRASTSLADAVANHPNSRRYSNSADLHIKSAIAGDVDSDGDLDIWVESTGGENIESHFMVNDGVGGFIAEDRMDPDLRTNRSEGELWRYDGAALVDLSGDGAPELVLGQIRDLDPTHINQSSVVLLNDGAGHFIERYKLPLPTFHQGHTSVPALTHHDLNGDGLQDLILLHQRNDGGPPGEPFTGRYMQVLLNRTGLEFEDVTDEWMGSQAATTHEEYAAGSPTMHDVDQDGCADLVISRSAPQADISPVVYRNSGTSFVPLLLDGLDDPYRGGMVPADLNGDGAIDFVSYDAAAVGLLNQ